MYNTKFILTTTNQEIYPGYLDKDRRKKLRDEHNHEKGYLKCGCRPNANLFYRISKNLSIYPEHNNYQHNKNCSRFINESGKKERQTGYVISEENGEVTAYLTFNPKNFSMAEEIKTDKIEEKDSNSNECSEDSQNDAIIEKDKDAVKNTEKSEPKLSLESLIKKTNIDTYTEKILTGKEITSRETFSKYVYHRSKKIRVDKMRKAIGDLSLENDGVRFIYLPYAGITNNKEKGLVKCYLQSSDVNGRVFNNFIFPETLAKALKKFVKIYNTEPNQDTMIAGFQYLKKSKSKSKYRVLGRIHLFQVSTQGLYCNNQIEKETFDSIHKFCKQDKNIEFWIPPEEDSIGGVINVKNKVKKILVLFRTSKDERISYDSSVYEPLIVGSNEPLTQNSLYQAIENLN